MCTVKKKKEKRLNQNSSVSLSLSITLSPCALLNSIKENSSAGKRGEGGLGFGEKQGKKGEDGEGKDFNIWFPHLKYINLSHPGALLKSGERGEEGLGGGRGKGARVLMTFSLWNLVSIVFVVNILPKDSTCHHGHTSSKLLNIHRWHYILHTHADNLVPVRLRWLFFSFSAVCQCQQVIYFSWVCHCFPHSSISFVLP